MTHPPATSTELARAQALIGHLCDNSLSVELTHELDQLVCSHVEIRRLYVQLMAVHADLRQQAALLDPCKSADSAVLSALVDTSIQGLDAIAPPATDDAVPSSPVVEMDLNDASILPAITPDTVSETEEQLPPGPTHILPKTPEKKRLRWGRAAAILLPIFSVLTIWTVHYHNRRTDECIVSLAINANWYGADDSALTPGSELATGTHNLRSGIVKLDLRDHGVVLTQAVIEGPAEFEVMSSSRVRLFKGKLCAQVISGTGLTVTTPDLTAVDLGTEFAIDVVTGKQTHLEVLQGQVKVGSPTPNAGSPAKTLRAGDAVLVSTGSIDIQKDTARPLAFLRPSQVEAADETAYQRWTRFSQSLRQDPSLVAYYPFDDQSVRANQLLNRAARTADQYAGTMGHPSMHDSSPTWSQGRWPGKSALQFGESRPTLVTISANGTLISRKAMTICAWIKRTDLVNQAHLLSGEDENGRAFNLGFVHELPAPSAGLSDFVNFTWSQFNVQTSQAHFRNGDWSFVAVTSTVNQATQFYRDGELFATVKDPGQAVVPVNTLVIGDAVPGSKLGTTSDYFKGVVDELMIYQRELSAEEIAQLYKTGKSSFTN